MLLLRGATYIQKHTQEAVLVSIHAPLARSNFKGFILSLCLQFQYMLLLRGATPCEFIKLLVKLCFNTCSSCEEQLDRAEDPLRYGVSIHAPLARSNAAEKGEIKMETSFNTCSSCEEQLSFLFAFCSSICFNTCSSCEEQL